MPPLPPILLVSWMNRHSGHRRGKWRILPRISHMRSSQGAGTDPEPVLLGRAVGQVEQTRLFRILPER